MLRIIRTHVYTGKSCWDIFDDDDDDDVTINVMVCC